MSKTANSTVSSLETIHRQRVMDELREVGASRYGLNRFDVRHLPLVIRPTEHIRGIVYGYDKGESMLLVATDHRIVVLRKKPLYVSQDDIAYYVVSGVSFSHAGLGSTVTLHTRLDDFTVHTFNRKAAGRFVHFIEFYCMNV